ncbi:hypothetical protein NDU88_003320 [Pleurodeles waltl]|uniref:Toll-like receptor 5 n=1 Tax=Pleurodeles waltl TaxID=8319 RepID=A0AAV7MU94_PLEWA|nr:hypothetical protein NDU88_003320 [Pleurodeles waltl]
MTLATIRSLQNGTMFCWIILLATCSAMAAPSSCNLRLVKNTIVANCMAQGHLTIPDISLSTEVILLSFNNITYLKESSFPPLGCAKTLTLGMQLAGKLYIGESAFRRLGNLTFLDVGGNKHLMLHDKAFAGLGKLEVLLLDHSDLKDGVLQNSYFEDLLSLKKLDLTGNQIQMACVGRLEGCLTKGLVPVRVKGTEWARWETRQEAGGEHRTLSK